MRTLGNWGLIATDQKPRYQKNYYDYGYRYGDDAGSAS